MTVREIAVGDLEGLLRLYTELHENPMPAQGETLSALWHGILEDKNHHIVVAEKKGEIVSWITRSSWRCSTIATR